MRSYLITFKSENKEQIIKHIKSFSGYAKIKEDVWIIQTNMKHKELRDNFNSLLKDGEDLLFVIDVNGSAWASLNIPNDVSNWLKKFL
jgi:hypothetical protein